MRSDAATQVIAESNGAPRVERSAGGWLHTRRMRSAGLAVSALVVFAVMVVSLAIGSGSASASDVVSAFTDFTGTYGQQLIRDSRLPRAVLGLMVGAALGLAGTVMQGITRNPLADPGILGIQAGAALGAVMAIQLMGRTDLASITWFGLIGAAVAAVVVTVIGSVGRGGADPVKLALAGVAATAMLTAITTGILLSDPSTLDSYRFWVVGSINDRGLEVAAGVAPFIVVGSILALACGYSLNSLALGDDVARGIGVSVTRVRVLGAAATVLLSGAAVAAAGPIVFVGLAVPHLARAIVGHDYRWILPWSITLGAAMLLASDVVGRVATPGELQVGVVTALLGAPVLILIVRRRNLGTL